MASLLLKWLNEDLRLSRSVQVLERDMSSCFLFAEILHHAGIEVHLSKFRDEESMNTKLQNMELLCKTLEKEGIRLSLEQKRSVVMENRSNIIKVRHKKQKTRHRRNH